jgi:hypothetical protein
MPLKCSIDVGCGQRMFKQMARRNPHFYRKMIGAGHGGIV